MYPEIIGRKGADEFTAHFSLVQSECWDALLTHCITFDPLANLGFQVPASLAGFHCEQISIASQDIPCVFVISTYHGHDMEENTCAVKIEPKNDMEYSEYNLHQDAKLIMEV
uniref:Uncharacterized protein n=1 Tax=Timema monikensis TaxID=170555 RepID=A0A7R9EIZ3_9NEOP|nr:unnamed protein product [Timema monikensis]